MIQGLSDERKPVVQRRRAQQDVDEAVSFYLGEGSQKTALNFIEALEQAYAMLAHHTASGSPRYAHALDLPGLRFWPLSRFPYLVFYLDRSDHVDVWRVLHAQRDLPVWLSEPDDDH
jgi:toxin ParE1/3/4